MKAQKSKSLISIIGGVLAALFLGAIVLSFARSCKKDDPYNEPSLPTAGTLNARLASAVGDVELTLPENMTLSVNDGGETVLGKAGANIVLDGENVGVINAIGGKHSVIRAGNAGSLTFKNFTINDKTDDSISGYGNYLYFGGDVTFENCTITDSIYFYKGTRAVFKDCKFSSTIANQYSVWIGDGSATFERCTFNGFRGLKVHEFEDLPQDVKSVEVDTCLFYSLTNKPGIAIGALDENSIVRVTGSTFDKCLSWDTVGSLTGVDGFYECDTPLADFSFSEESNTITNIRYKISYKWYSLEKEIEDIPEKLFKSDANYPTSYVSGEETTIDDLGIWKQSSHVSYEFEGWYFDYLCSDGQEFDGVITSDMTGDLTIYALIGIWVGAGNSSTNELPSIPIYEATDPYVDDCYENLDIFGELK